MQNLDSKNVLKSITADPAGMTVPACTSSLHPEAAGLPASRNMAPKLKVNELRLWALLSNDGWQQGL